MLNYNDTVNITFNNPKPSFLMLKPSRKLCKTPTKLSSYLDLSTVNNNTSIEPKKYSSHHKLSSTNKSLSNEQQIYPPKNGQIISATPFIKRVGISTVDSREISNFNEYRLKKSNNSINEIMTQLSYIESTISKIRRRKKSEIKYQKLQLAKQKFSRQLPPVPYPYENDNDRKSEPSFKKSLQMPTIGDYIYDPNQKMMLMKEMGLNTPLIHTPNINDNTNNDDDLINFSFMPKNKNEGHSLITMIQSIGTLIKLKNFYKQIRMNTKELLIKEFPRKQHIAQESALSWVAEAIRPLMHSVINTNNINLILDKNLPAKEVQSRARNIKTRIKIILSSLDECISKISKSVLMFLKLLISENSYVPTSFWQDYQKQLIIRSDGVNCQMSKEIQKSVLLDYLYIRILTANVLYSLNETFFIRLPEQALMYVYYKKHESDCECNILHHH